MSKFIRLTSGHPDYQTSFVVNVDAIETIFENPIASPTNEKTIIETHRGRYLAHEASEQILALIEGDESGLRERVAFLEKALDQAIRAGGFYIDGLTVRDGEDSRFAQVADVPELAEEIRKREAQS